MTYRLVDLSSIASIPVPNQQLRLNQTSMCILPEDQDSDYKTKYVVFKLIQST
jgi:hypothetical protein